LFDKNIFEKSYLHFVIGIWIDFDTSNQNWNW